MKCCYEGCEDTCKCNPVAHNHNVASRAAHSTVRVLVQPETSPHNVVAVAPQPTGRPTSRYRRKMVDWWVWVRRRRRGTWKSGATKARSADGEITGILRASHFFVRHTLSPSVVAFGATHTSHANMKRNATVVIRRPSRHMRCAWTNHGLGEEEKSLRTCLVRSGLKKNESFYS